MSRPFQFSMRRMLGSVTLFCIGASLLECLTRYAGDNVHVVLLGIFLAGASFAASVSLFSRRPVLFAVCGGVSAVLIAYAAGRLWMPWNHPYQWEFPFNIFK